MGEAGDAKTVRSGPAGPGIARMMRRPALRQRFRGTFAQEALDRKPLRAHVVELQCMRAGTRDHDEVDPRRHEIRARSETFAAQSLDAISTHGVADFACHDEPEPRWAVGARLGGDEQREVTRADAPAIALRHSEFGVPSQPAIRPESERRGGPSGDWPVALGHAYFL
jgi:hypothetical protein